MRKIDQLFSEYAESHQNKANKFIHWICVPLIFFTIVGFISLIPISLTKILNDISHYSNSLIGHIHIGNSFINFMGIVILIMVTIFYFKLSRIISIIMFFIMLMMFYISSKINQLFNNSWIIYLSIFVITWIFQFLGHKIEGKKPSFLKDLQFLLVGPIWLLHFILKKIGIPY